MASAAGGDIVDVEKKWRKKRGGEKIGEKKK